MKIAIIGYDLEGHTSYDYWKDKGDITICDQNLVEVPENVHEQLGNNYLAGIGRFDLIVRTPSLKPKDLVDAAGAGILERVTTNTNEFFKVCPTKNIIGITGTKGKGTTSTLIAKILEAAGKKVHLGGNIGVPALSLLDAGINKEDWVVLELSSFQLMDLKYSPHIAVCLMVVPEHLDWHSDIDEYYNAKTQLFRHQTPDDIAIYYAGNDNSFRIGTTGKGWKIPYYDEPGAVIKNGWVQIANEDICATNELALRGKHNWQNVCAAVTAAWQITKNKEALREVLTTFKGLEHRIEFVRELNGLSYYDDSFGTTPETAIVAIESFDEPKVVIVGGSDKGAQYSELAEAIKNNNVRSVIAIGQQGPFINNALKNAGFDSVIEGAKDMPAIVFQAQASAHPGDVVLLSPGCASFDMFKNYKDRGDQFKQAVLALS